MATLSANQTADLKKATPTYHGWNEVEQTSDNSSDKEIYF